MSFANACCAYWGSAACLDASGQAGHATSMRSKPCSCLNGASSHLNIQGSTSANQSSHTVVQGTLLSANAACNKTWDAILLCSKSAAYTQYMYASPSVPANSVCMLSCSVTLGIWFVIVQLLGNERTADLEAPGAESWVQELCQPQAASHLLSFPHSAFPGNPAPHTVVNTVSMM